MQAIQEEDYTRRLDLGLWRKMLRLAKPFHRNLWIVVVTMLLSAGIDVVLPLLNSYAIDHFIAEKTTAGLGWFSALYIGLVLVQMCFIILFIHQSGYVETGMCYHIRKLGFR